ncbi:MAG TPA: hypothetical protein VGQ35_21225 [Dongiaceae bacterium]|jgi:hypothetical protein|nr:hypothetical protein [Dongiaceae bacterium]
MTVASPLLELRQTREFTQREKRDLTRLWGKLAWRKGAGRLYDFTVCMWYGFAAFLALTILMAVKKLAIDEPDLSAQLAFAAIGFAVFLFGTDWLSRRLHRSMFWVERRTGDRYVMAADGLHSNTFRGTFSCGWNRVEAVHNDERHLIALLPGSSGLFLVKAAFESQDIESFGAELVRRWQAHRDSFQPESAP